MVMLRETPAGQSLLTLTVKDPPSHTSDRSHCICTRRILSSICSKTGKSTSMDRSCWDHPSHMVMILQSQSHPTMFTSLFKVESV